MSISNALPAYLRPRRAKLFTDGRQTPVDRNDRARGMFLAHAARRRGEITRAAVDIFHALLFKFANLDDGRCFPSRARIAEAAGCVERTVGNCLPDLEAAGLLTWVNRIQRVRERVAGLGGLWATTWRVIRTSNAYDFPSLAKAKHVVLDEGQKARGLPIKDSSSLIPDPDNPAEAAILRFAATFQARQERKAS